MTRSKRIKVLVTVVLGVAVVGAAVVVIVDLNGCSYSSYNPPPAIEAKSDGLKATVVVPTLDSPVPKGRNIIWCGSLQLAWDGLRGAGVRPVPSGVAKAVADRLNAAVMSDSDMPPGGYYAASGAVQSGIAGKIKSDMASRFPGVKPDMGPLDSLGPGDYLAYAYLAANVKFSTPYGDRKGGDEFTDSAGNKTRVASFGMFQAGYESATNEKLAAQIAVRFARREKREHELKEFALDLDKNSKPSQLILACVEPKATLAETWADVIKKMEQAPPDKSDARFTSEDSLVVPDVVFKLQHRFSELESPGAIIRAFQMIDFRLDKSGAVLVSETHVYAAGIPRCFSFTRPFLIAMRKRGATNPYFVMWVDNAELLSKAPTPGN